MITTQIFSKVKLKQKALLDFEEFYKWMLRWFKFHGYKWKEVEYADMDEANGKHLEIQWDCTKEIDSYVRFRIKVDFLILGMKEQEIEREGVKTKLHLATWELRFSAINEKDYQNQWSTPFMRLLRNLYERILARGRMEAYDGELYKDASELMAETRAYLNLFGGAPTV